MSRLRLVRCRWEILLAAVCSALGAGATPTIAELPKPASAKATVDDTQDLAYLSPRSPVFLRTHLRFSGKTLYEMRQKLAQDVLTELDANKNGVLDGTEVAEVPTPELIAAASRLQQGATAASTQKADADPADGKVTLDELTSYLLAQGGPAFSLNLLDNDSNENQVAVNGFFQRIQSNLAPLLKSLDGNGDGRIDDADIAQAERAFRRLDLNDDDTISRFEAFGIADPGVPTASGMSSPFAGLATLLVPIDRWGSRSSVARKLVQLYDKTARDPKTKRAGKDRKLSAAELGVEPKSIALFDKNHDSALDHDELQAWLAQPTPTFEVAFEVGNSANASTIKLAKAGAPVADGQFGLKQDATGRLQLQTGRTVVDLRVGDPSNPAVRSTSNYKQVFKRADANKNDYLEPGEIFNTGIVNNNDFQAMDRDNNSMVFEKEFVPFVRMRDGLADGRVSLAFSMSTLDPVAKFDTSGDKKLSQTEFKNAIKAIKGWDKNSDGRVSFDEVPRQSFATLEKGTPNRRNNFRSNSSSAGGAIAKALSGGVPWFTRMDRNRDDEVSLREFLGPIAVFRKLDADKNEFLTVAEALESLKK